MSQYDELGTGGIEVGGSGETPVIYNIYGSDGIEVGGDSLVLTNYNINGSGGIEGAGTAYITRDIPVFGTGGATVSGIAYAVRVVSILGTGGSVSGGQSSSNIIFNPKTSGGLKASGNSIDKILVASSLSIPLLFDLGDLPVYAYRVLGDCSKLDCTNIPFKDASNNCGNQVINYILARNIGDVCTQLSSYDFVFKVKAVYKYSRAIIGIDHLQNIKSGIEDPVCPNFEDVTEDFCSQAQCFDFCLADNMLFLAKCIFTAGIYHPNNSYGSLQLTGGYTIVKSSNYNFFGSGNLNLNVQAGASGNGLIPLSIFVGSGALNLSGNANIGNSYLGEFTETISGDLILDAISLNLDGPDGLQLVGQTQNQVANICGCPTLLNYVEFESNLFTKASLLSDFLYRNNYTVEKTTRLYFNQNTKTFYNCLKYDGIGTSSTDYETWSIVLELSCTGQISLSGDYLWNFSIFASRKLYSNNILKNNLETRFYVYIPTSLLYNNSSSFLEFDFQIDVKALIVYNQYKEIIFNLEPRILKDNTKLFSSGDWINDPYLNVFVYTIKTNLSEIFRPNKNLGKINILPLVNFP